MSDDSMAEYWKERSRDLSRDLLSSGQRELNLLRKFEFATRRINDFLGVEDAFDKIANLNVEVVKYIQSLVELSDRIEADIRAKDDEIERLRGEVHRLRSRVRVESEDVESFGVTRDRILSWMIAKGWTKIANEDCWETWRFEFGECRFFSGGASADLVLVIWQLARAHRLSGFDILDEIGRSSIEP